MDENENIKEPKPWAWWLAATAICLAIWFGGYIFTKWLSGCSCIFQVDGGTSPSALFGDSFGGVNALVSALAFAGMMIVTFAFQRYELGLQRQELKAQREEFSANVTLRLQRFENTFFNTSV